MISVFCELYMPKNIFMFFTHEANFATYKILRTLLLLILFFLTFHFAKEKSVTSLVLFPCRISVFESKVIHKIFFFILVIQNFFLEVRCSFQRLTLKHNYSFLFKHIMLFSQKAFFNFIFDYGFSLSCSVSFFFF